MIEFIYFVKSMNSFEATKMRTNDTLVTYKSNLKKWSGRMNCCHLSGWFHIVILLIVGVVKVQSQPLDREISLIDDTPVFSEAGVNSFTPNGPIILARTPGDDREPKLSILDGSITSVFWVNRNGSHHVNGIAADGSLISPVVETDSDTDAVVGINTTQNTNWTLNKSSQDGTVFVVAATYLADTLVGSLASIPETVVAQDNREGHGFFRLFNTELNPVSPPISVGEFTAGHREWDCCWLPDGKLVIGVVSRGFQFPEDPDWPAGGNQVVTINIFNSDGTRYKEEFFIDDLTGTQGDVRLGALMDGFVCVYRDDDSNVGGSVVYRGLIFDLEGNKKKEFVVSDLENNIHPEWMDAGGGSQFVTISSLDGPANIGLPDGLVNVPIVLAQLWSKEGVRMGPYILISQHNELRGVSRPRVAMARNGTFSCSWIDSGADLVTFSDSVVGRIMNADGMPATNAFVVHPIPEFADNLIGGDPGEPMTALNEDRTAFAWGSRSVPDGQLRDIVAMTFENPGTHVLHWYLY